MSKTPRTDNFCMLPIKSLDTEDLLQGLRNWKKFSIELELDLADALDCLQSVRAILARLEEKK